MAEPTVKEVLEQIIWHHVGLGRATNGDDVLAMVQEITTSEVFGDAIANALVNQFANPGGGSDLIWEDAQDAVREALQ